MTLLCNQEVAKIVETMPDRRKAGDRDYQNRRRSKES